MAEFPLLQRLIHHYEAKSDKVAFLTIQTHPSEDEDMLVSAIMQKGKFEFTVLRVPDEEWAQRELNHVGYQTQILDPEGRLIYDWVLLSDVDHLSEAERMIDALLARVSAQSAAK